ncbi:hypothetical protein [Neobacillus niacini]|uniref:hypothetical protein n=1 Tax=Neobacillus niacini TaxID=86668 RepID=UPI00286340D4|nr:hypothetical protein [Neobacillus niacini]MDR6999112.1 hypothetical protein [Neobacillus niacini]
MSTLDSINAHQYVYYGYTYVGDINGTINIKINTSSSVTITSYNLSLNNAKGYGQRVDSSYLSPATGNPAKLYYNFSFEMKTSYIVTGYVPFHTIYYVYPDGHVTFNNDESMK